MNHFCIHIFRTSGECALHTNPSHCSNCVTLLYLGCVTLSEFKCDNHYKAIEKLKYAKAYVSETFVTTYFEYLVITLSMSQSVSQSMSYSMNKKIQRDEAKYYEM